MKRMKQIAVLLLAVLMLVLGGCRNQAKLDEQVHNELRGSWSTTIFCSDQTKLTLLENIDLEQTEIDLLAVDGPKLVKIAHFDNGNYRFEIDTDAVRENVRSFYNDVFSALYEKREELNDLYNKTFDDMSYEEFLKFYAELYGYADAETMLNALADEAFDYDAMNVVETGTYTAEAKNLIYCTPNESHADAGTLRFSVRGDALNIAFSNGDEVYNRITE